MSNSDQHDNERLDKAWQEIEKAISDLGARVRKEAEGLSPQHRFEGYKGALTLLADSCFHQIHFDPKRPEVLPYCGPLLNHAAPSGDFIYRLVHLEPGKRYRVWGRRGDAEIIDFQFLANYWGRYEGSPASDIPPLETLGSNQTIDEIGVSFDAQGNFDCIMSAQPHEGQWWKIDARTSTIMIREYFTDYAAQNRRTDIYFDRLDGKDEGSTVGTVDDALQRFHYFANDLYDLSGFFRSANQIKVAVGDNRHQQIDYTTQIGVADQRYCLVRYNIKPTEALIGEWSMPPELEYWGITLVDHYFRLLNIWNRQANLNKSMVSISQGGILHFVISQQDPGIRNWLDPDGHEQGVIWMRTKGGKGPADNIKWTLVPASDVMKHLPEDIALVTPEERAQALALRRRHFHLRDGR